jgi:hypothetical protein
MTQERFEPLKASPAEGTPNQPEKKERPKTETERERERKQNDPEWYHEQT